MRCENVIFASQLGSFAGSMWPKPQSRIVVAVGQCDGDLVAQVTVPAVVENAGWFDAVVVIASVVLFLVGESSMGADPYNSFPDPFSF